MMKRRVGWWGCLGLAGLAAMAFPPPSAAEPDDGRASPSEAVPYGVGQWPESGFGNHRAVVRVAGTADAVAVRIPWRRRDRDVNEKAVLVYAADGSAVANRLLVRADHISGDLAFQPAQGAGEYFIYYLPYKLGGTFVAEQYFRPQTTADAAWLEQHKLAKNPARGWARLPRAQTVRLEARTEFNRLDPMEVVASDAEVAALKARHPDRAYLVFPEDRAHAIRMRGDLPVRWLAGPARRFAGAAQPGESYPFQLGVWAARGALADLSVEFADWRGPGGAVLPAAAFTCLNRGGVDAGGKPFARRVDVPAGAVEALWIVAAIPLDAPSGTYAGSVTVRPAGGEPTAVEAVLAVGGATLDDGGAGDGERLARLAWLDSARGQDVAVVAPYIPLARTGDTVRLLDREVAFAPSGLPEQLTSRGHDLLAAPARFVARRGGKESAFAAGPAELLNEMPGRIERRSTGRLGGLDAEVRSMLEFDGTLSYWVTLRGGAADADLDDLFLDLPLRAAAAKYFMGLGVRSGLRRGDVRWKWDIERPTNTLWIGDVDAGLYLKLQTPSDRWTTRNHRPTGLPASWDNGGRGGAEVVEDGDAVRVRAWSGPRRLAAGETLEFRFRLAVTPFKPIDRRRWTQRVSTPEQGVNLKYFAESNANVLTLHHAQTANPHINYPFSRLAELRQVMDGLAELERSRPAAGRLDYPLDGVLDPRRGALHLRVKLLFDPAAGKAGDPRFNRTLARLLLDGGREASFYWNVDERGMRAYVRRTPKDYEKITYSRSDWRQGESHVLTLSWGERLETWVDGRRLASEPLAGLGVSATARALLRLAGDGFALGAMRLDGVSYTGGSVSFDRPGDALLLERWSGPARTRPAGVLERPAAGPAGRIHGAAEIGDDGHLRLFGPRVPPYGLNLYYTVRELSNAAKELWAFRALGDEIIAPPDSGYVFSNEATMTMAGGGYPWLREHLYGGYTPAWRSMHVMPEGGVDAAIATQPGSRLENFYVEGVHWLATRMGVTGLYLDGIGYGRETMRRVQQVLQRADPGYRIDMHVHNSYDSGDLRCGGRLLYLEHHAYATSAWTGEMYDFDTPPDYWLVELAGIPFGVGGDMLEWNNGGHIWRGMLYGMNGRYHPAHAALWSLWDDFGMADAEMLGYWNERNPIRSKTPGVLATLYRQGDEALLAVAHWPSRLTSDIPLAEVPRLDPPSAVADAVGGEATRDMARLAAFARFGASHITLDPGDQSEVYVSAGAKGFHIRFVCHVRPGESPQIGSAGRDGPLGGDVMNLFLQPDRGDKTFYRFAGNAHGGRMDAKGMDVSWNGDWEYAAQRHPDRWTGSAFIPYATLGMAPPTVGTEVGFNAGRDHHGRKGFKHSIWSRKLRFGYFHPEHFGRLRIAEGAPTREEPATEPYALGTVPVELEVDWAALGWKAGEVRAVVPALNHFQEARAEMTLGEPFAINSGQGLLLRLAPRKGSDPAQ